MLSGKNYMLKHLWDMLNYPQTGTKHVSDMLSGKNYMLKHGVDLLDCPQSETKQVLDMLSGKAYMVNHLREWVVPRDRAACPGVLWPQPQPSYVVAPRFNLQRL